MSVIERQSPEDRPDASAETLDVLVLGTMAGHGGIYHYIQQQRERLGDDVAASTYDVYAPGAGEGLAWLLRTVILTAWAMVRFPFRRRPDVVHAHTSARLSFYRIAPYVLVASLLWRRPVVLHVHGSSFDEFVETDSRAIAALQSLVFAASDRIVVLSPYWREVLSKRVPDEKLVVLPNAVAPGEYDPTFDADPPRIVFVSNLIERKGVPALVEAVEMLDGELEGEYRVDVAGLGTLADRVETLAERNDEVSYWGYVSEDRKRELLSEGTIYVLPTHADNQPIALLEGMAGGNAVVATPVGAIPDVLDPDDRILVEPGNPGELADALSSLLSSPEEVERMARRNREQIEREYTWERAAGRLTDLYEDLARD